MQLAVCANPRLITVSGQQQDLPCRTSVRLCGDGSSMRERTRWRKRRQTDWPTPISPLERVGRASALRPYHSRCRLRQRGFNRYRSAQHEDREFVLDRADGIRNNLHTGAPKRCGPTDFAEEAKKAVIVLLPGSLTNQSVDLACRRSPNATAKRWPSR